MIRYGEKRKGRLGVEKSEGLEMGLERRRDEIA